MTLPHLRIATVSCNNLQDAVAAMQANGEADQIEVRLDALWPAPPEADQAADTIIQLLDAAPVPLLATLRPTRQGGHFDGPEEVRLSLLSAAAQAGFTAVDLEADLEEARSVVHALHEAGAQVTLSQHGFAKAPSKDAGLIHLQSMQDALADRQKVAFPAGAFPDFLRALELAWRFQAVNGKPIALPIGFGGAMGRALLPLAGCAATYGHADGSPAAVSGQPALTDIQSVWDHWGLSNDELPCHNGWFAVLGDSVEHSLSPRIHNHALKTAGRAERYGAMNVPDSIGAVRLLFGVAERIGLKGAGITAPLKVHALDACMPDETATAVGAVNTVRFTAAGPEGTNTDSTGLQQLTQECSGAMVVLGAGGAARAAIHAGQANGFDVTFCSRDEERAKRVQQQFNVPWVPWADRATLTGDVWIQCTSMGSNPDDASPVDATPGAKLAIEMVYAAGPTKFQAVATASGATIIDGAQVLLNQAADQYRYWTGEDPPKGAMEGTV